MKNLYEISYSLNGKENSVFVNAASGDLAVDFVIDAFENAGKLTIIEAHRVETLNEIVKSYHKEGSK